MGFKGKFSILTCLLLLIMGFQNCSPSNAPVSFNEDSSKLANETDSGTPYEGKIYATLGSLCADGTEIQSRIVVASATKAELNRENCQEITPIALSPNEFQVSADENSLIYKNQNFKYLGAGPFGISNFSFSNDANNFYYSYTYEGQPTFLQIFLDTDNNPATGFAREGIGADFLIENDNVWKYSAPVGSPQDTWAWTSHVSANKTNIAPNVSWSFARSSIASPSVIKLVAQTSLGGKTSVIIQNPK